MTGIPKGLLIAAGIGAVGIGGYMLFKGDDKPKEGADPASKDVAGAGDGTGASDPTGATPGAQTDGLPRIPGTADGGAAQGTDGLPPGAQQVGPYTVIPDPQTGTQVVFETATRQPVGVLDANGTLQPIGGQPDPSTASVVGAPTPGATTPAGTVSGVPAGPATSVPSGTGLGAPGAQAQAGASQYSQVAAALFANAGNGSVGAASSDAMSGAGGLVPPAAAPTTGLSSVAPQPATTAPLAAAPAGQQQYAVVKDPESGVDVVLDAATQQPLGVLDPATGELVTIEQLQAAQSTAPAAGAMAPAAGVGAMPAGIG